MKKLETSRLKLRHLNENDFDWLFQLHSNPEVMKYIWPCYPKAVEKEKEYKRISRMIAYNEQQGKFGYFAIALKSTNESIGWACLKHLDNTELIEIGYRLQPEYWGNGYATEASLTLRDYGFNTLNLDKIVGITAPANEPSKKVLKKIGLQYIGKDFYYNTNVDFFELKKQL